MIKTRKSFFLYFVLYYRIMLIYTAFEKNLRQMCLYLSTSLNIFDLQLNLASKVWKKNCPNFCTLYKVGRKSVITFPYFHAGFSFFSDAMNFFIHSSGRFVSLLFLKMGVCVAGFLHLSALYANIRHGPWSEYNLLKSEHTEHQRS